MGPLSHLGYKQMKEPSSLTGTQKKKVVNEESERAHYDNMQHSIKSFVLLLARVRMKGLPVSNALGLDVCEKQCQEQKQMEMNKNMSIRP